MNDSSKIHRTYAKAGDVYKAPKGGFYQSSGSAGKDSKFRKGEVLKGKVVSLLSRKVAKVSLPGRTVSAEIHNGLEPGDELFFIVDQVSPYLVLKVYSVMVGEGESEKSSAEILRVLDFPDEYEYEETIEVLKHFKGEIVRSFALRTATSYIEKKKHGKFLTEPLISSYIQITDKNLSEADFDSYYSFFSFTPEFTRKTVGKLLELKSSPDIVADFIRQYLLFVNYIKPINELPILSDVTAGNIEIPKAWEHLHRLNTSFRYAKDFCLAIPTINGQDLSCAKIIVKDKSGVSESSKQQSYRSFVERFASDTDFSKAIYSSNNSHTKFAEYIVNSMPKNKVILKFLIIPDIDGRNFYLKSNDFESTQTNFSVVI